MKSTGVFLIAILLSTPLPSWSSASDCSKIEALTNDELVTWLSMKESSAEPECLAAAIIRAGDLKNAKAVPPLLDLLDFPRPQADTERLHISSLRDKYPAVPALFSIGKVVIPAVVERLKKGDLNVVAHQNAIRLLLLLHRDDPASGIKMLRAEGLKCQDRIEMNRLHNAAADLARQCPKDWRESCETAFNEAARESGRR